MNKQNQSGGKQKARDLAKTKMHLKIKHHSHERSSLLAVPMTQSLVKFPETQPGIAPEAVSDQKIVNDVRSPDVCSLHTCGH